MNAALTLDTNAISLNSPKKHQKRQLSIKERNALALQHKGLVRKAANEYAYKCKEPLADLEQIGYLGLIKAIERYDPVRAAFSSFAMPYIRGAILHHLRDRSHAVKVPRAWQECYQSVKRKAASTGGKPEQLAAAMGLDAHQWQEATRAMQNWTLDLNDDICENLASSSATPQDYALRAELVDAVEQLQPTHRRCVELVFFQEISKRQAAKQLNLSCKQLDTNIEQALQLLAAKLG
jgi:RNA polymerase sigma-B factor